MLPRHVTFCATIKLGYLIGAAGIWKSVQLVNGFILLWVNCRVKATRLNFVKQHIQGGHTHRSPEMDHLQRR